MDLTVAEGRIPSAFLTQPQGLPETHQQEEGLVEAARPLGLEAWLAVYCPVLSWLGLVQPV